MNEQADNAAQTPQDGQNAGGEGLNLGTGETPQEERLYAGKYKSIGELEKAYSEAQKLISKRTETEAQTPEAPAPEAPKPQEQPLDPEYQNYLRQKHRDTANEKLGVELSVDDWSSVVEYADKTFTPDQIEVMNKAIEAGMYDVLRPVVEGWTNAKGSEGDEVPVGSTPKGEAVSGGKGFESVQEAKEFFRMANGFSNPAKAREWQERLAATHPRIRAEMAPNMNKEARFGQ